MAVLFALQPYLTKISAAGSFLLILHLWRIGLVGKYQSFVGFLLVHGTVLTVLSNIRRNTTLFGDVYLVGQGLLWLFYLLVVIELYRRVLAMYPAIAGLAQYVVVISLGVSLVVSFSMLPREMSGGPHVSTVILRHMAIQRAVTAAMCLHLIVITWFLSWMLVSLPKNTIYHTALFFFYFLSEAVGNLYRNLTGSVVTEEVNVLLQICTLLAFFGWLVLLRREGEALPERRPGAAAADSSRILRQMEQVNQALSRGTRE